MRGDMNGFCIDHVHFGSRFLLICSVNMPSAVYMLHPVIVQFLANFRGKFHFHRFQYPTWDNIFFGQC